MFLRICPYFPFNARICVNQHEWLARRLHEEGIFYRKAANASIQCSKPDRLQQLADSLKQGLSGVRIMELAREDPEHPYGGCGSVWRAAVRCERLVLEHEQAVADVPIRFEGLPGEYLQVDWGEIRHFPFTQQTPVTRYFLACRLKYSRWTWVTFTDNMRQETLFRGLVACFNALGFVPWVLVFDNMKTVTTGRDDQQQPIWHRSLLQLAAEFDFHPEACWPASGNQKGSVESLVKFVKINFLSGRSFINDADLQAQCLEWQDAYVHHQVPQAQPPGPPPATGVDYLGLVLAEHDEHLLGQIAYRDLPRALDQHA